VGWLDAIGFVDLEDFGLSSVVPLLVVSKDFAAYLLAISFYSFFPVLLGCVMIPFFFLSSIRSISASSNVSFCCGQETVGITTSCLALVLV
jgi:hypothetical protein